MAKEIKHQKKMNKFNLADLTEEQAKEKGKIFYQAWKEFEEERKKENRKKIEKVLDSKRKK
jgi:hypothetical protein